MEHEKYKCHTMSQSDDVAIRVSNVSKAFKLPHEKQTSVKSLFVSLFNGRQSYERQQVLKDVSFEINKGEFFGIVGRNGSGKSTLLKLLAGIYTPDKGHIQVNGKLTPFIELGVGFNPELTGRENVYLNGALLGFSRKEMDAMYDEIVEFAELEKFMDQKLKNYSSGMQVRLAFSIAIRAQTDILVLDEVLAVGDLDFQKKCYEHFYDLKRLKRTVILVTHDMSAVRRFCTKGVLIKNGIIINTGDSEKIAEQYESMNLKAAETRVNLSNKEANIINEGNGQAELVSVSTFNTKNNNKQDVFNANESIGVRLEYRAKTKINKPAVGFIFQDQKDTTVFATNNIVAKKQLNALEKNDKLVVKCEVENVFTDGTYSITCALESDDFLSIYDRTSYVHRFMIGGHKLAHATTHPRTKYNISYKVE